MKTYTAEDFKRWGAQGGRKSRRKLTKAQARAMVRARTAKASARRANQMNKVKPTKFVKILVIQGH